MGTSSLRGVTSYLNPGGGVLMDRTRTKTEAMQPDQWVRNRNTGWNAEYTGNGAGVP